MAEPGLEELIRRERIRAALAGQTGWGEHASADRHLRYALPMERRSRRRCVCGCGRRASHTGCANGMAMMYGCELWVARWVRVGPRGVPR